MTLRGRLLTVAVILGLACVLAGCGLINSVSPGKQAAEQRAQQLQGLQLSVMRFADEYVGRSNEVLSRFITTTDITPEQRLGVQN